MTTADEILEAIESIAREHLELGRRLTGSDRLIEDLGLDSLKLLTLAVEVENRFQICLDEEDEEAIATVDDLVQQVRAKLGAAEAE